MTNDEFRSALKALGLRQRWLAQRLGLATSTVNRWATGEAPVAPYVPFVLDLITELREIADRLSPPSPTPATPRLPHPLP